MSHHRLILLRHAKSAYPPSVFDHQRPLAPRGRAQAPLAGAAIAAAFPTIDLVLCSDAVRTSQTLDYSGLAERAKQVRYVPEIYEASVSELLAVLADVPAAARSVLLIGHGPGLPGLVFELCADEARPGLLSEVEKRFPTSAFAVLAVPSFSSPQPATLEDFQIPR